MLEMAKFQKLPEITVFLMFCRKREKKKYIADFHLWLGGGVLVKVSRVQETELYCQTQT